MWHKVLLWLIIIFFLLLGLPVVMNRFLHKKPVSSASQTWTAPDSTKIPLTKEGDLIRYGRKLITNTADYFGPDGAVAHTANGMNCQNCHVGAGTRVFANNFSAVASTYPKFRPRSGRIESIEWRINDCFERSLNGKKIDSTGREMQAMVAYLKWLGKDVPKDTVPKGNGVENLTFMKRAADTLKGKLVYLAKCQSCHGSQGQGLLKVNAPGYIYPPLWGPRSYNKGAGLFRLSKFAGYVKNNMPFGTSYPNPQLSTEEAWDVAAFVNAQARPDKDLSKDWPKLATKPFDYPFGPYTDSFSESQHKFGPFEPISQAQKRNKPN